MRAAAGEQLMFLVGLQWVGDRVMGGPRTETWCEIWHNKQAQAERLHAMVS